MKIQDLSVGDWVNVLNYHWDGSPYTGQIDGIIKKHGTYYLQFGSALSAEIDRCEPIPITKEILEKNGFKLKEESERYIKTDDFYDVEICEYNDGLWIVTLTDCEFTLPHSQVHVSYVHQLQQAMRLYGIEKEIEL